MEARVKSVIDMLTAEFANEEAEMREFDLPDDIAEPATEEPAEVERT